MGGPSCALKLWGQSWQRGNYNINTSGQNWELASQQTLHPEFWILKSFSFRFLTRGGKSLSAMADVLIRSFSKILSLLVGPTNVAIDNWTFQMFYKVQQTCENIIDGNFICCFRLHPCFWELVPSSSVPGLFINWYLLKARCKISLFWQQF